jgi:hypothetical protein
MSDAMAADYDTVLTVKELKQLLATWPEVDANGEPTEVWMMVGLSRSAPVVMVRPLSGSRTADGNPADLIVHPPDGTFPSEPNGIPPHKPEPMAEPVPWSNAWLRARGMPEIVPYTHGFHEPTTPEPKGDAPGLATRPPTWAKDLPTAAGYYWWRRVGDSGHTIVRVEAHNGKLIERSIDAEGYIALGEYGGEWCGPIQPPEVPS